MTGDCAHSGGAGGGRRGGRGHLPVREQRAGHPGVDPPAPLGAGSGGAAAPAGRRGDAHRPNPLLKWRRAQGGRTGTAHVGHDWDLVVGGGHGDRGVRAAQRQSIGEIARATRRDAWDVFFTIARVGAFAMPQSMSEANKIKAMRQEFISFDTDAGPAPAGGGAQRVSHPRAYGAFPRVLARYVRDLGVLSLEGAVQRMSAVAANEIMAYDRGRLSVGLAADIVGSN